MSVDTQAPVVDVVTISSLEKTRRFLQDHPIAILTIVFLALYAVTGSQDPAMFSMPGIRSLLLLAAPPKNALMSNGTTLGASPSGLRLAFTRSIVC